MAGTTRTPTSSPGPDDRQAALAAHLTTLVWAHTCLPAPGRAAYWQRSAAASGASLPLLLAHDLGALLTLPPDRLTLARPPHLPADLDTAPYLAWLQRLALHPTLRTASAWDLSDAVGGVLLARLLQGVPCTDAYALPPDTAAALDFTRQLAAQLQTLDPAALWRHTSPTRRPSLTDLLPPPAMAQVEANLLTLDLEEVRFLHHYGPRLAGAPDPRDLLDLFTLLNLPPTVRQALAQVLRLLPTVTQAVRPTAAQTYAMGGYAGLTHVGSLDSLVPTELAYPQDFFFYRLLNGQALYYGREAEQEQPHRLAYLLTQAGPGLFGDGDVLARALTLALAQAMHRRGYHVQHSFIGSTCTPPAGLARPADVHRLLYYADASLPAPAPVLARVLDQVRSWQRTTPGLQLLWVIDEHWDAEGWEARQALYRAVLRDAGSQAWYVHTGEDPPPPARPATAGLLGPWQVVATARLWQDRPPPVVPQLTPQLAPAPAWHGLRQAIEAGGFRDGQRDVLHFAAEEAQLAAWHRLAALDGEPDQASIDAYLASLAPAGQLYIPAGRFLMGSPDDDPEARDNEKPQHELWLPGYYIGRYPLTHAEFARFIEAGGYTRATYWTEALAAGHWRNGKYRWFISNLRDPPEFRNIFSGLRDQPKLWDDSSYNDPQQPVVGISWYEALAYSRWAGARLPSEAEWEKAASWDPVAGRRRRYPWGDEWDERLGNWGEKVGRTTPVGQYPGGSSAYGLGDVAGNVWEWCSTRRRGSQGGQDYRYPYTASDGREDLAGGDEAWRCMRGASWWGDMDDARRWARCGQRNGGDPGDGGKDLGMRMVAPRYLSSADSGF